MSTIAPGTPAQAGQATKADAAAAARQLEAYFLRQVLATMPDNALMGGAGVGGSTIQGMFNEVLADAVAAGGDIGLATQIEASMQPSESQAKPSARSAQHDPTSFVDEITSRRARDDTGLTSVTENGVGE